MSACFFRFLHELTVFCRQFKSDARQYEKQWHMKRKNAASQSLTSKIAIPFEQSIQSIRLALLVEPIFPPYYFVSISTYRILYMLHFFILSYLLLPYYRSASFPSYTMYPSIRFRFFKYKCICGN